MSTASTLFNQFASKKNFKQSGNFVRSTQPGKPFSSTEALNYIPTGYNTSGGNMFKYGALASSLLKRAETSIGRKLVGGEKAVLGAVVDEAAIGGGKLMSKFDDASLRIKKGRRKIIGTDASGYGPQGRLRNARQVVDKNPVNTRDRSRTPKNNMSTGKSTSKLGKSPLGEFDNWDGISNGGKMATYAAAGVSSLIAGGVTLSAMSNSKKSPVGSAVTMGVGAGLTAAALKGGAGFLLSRGHAGKIGPAFTKSMKAMSNMRPGKTALMAGGSMLAVGMSRRLTDM